MARLIPPIDVESISLKPERDVARALVQQLPDDCHVYHSYPWLREERNDISANKVLRQGEADFVVIMPGVGGMMVLEAKAGGI